LQNDDSLSLQTRNEKEHTCRLPLLLILHQRMGKITKEKHSEESTPHQLEQLLLPKFCMQKLSIRQSLAKGLCSFLLESQKRNMFSAAAEKPRTL